MWRTQIKKPVPGPGSDRVPKNENRTNVVLKVLHKYFLRQILFISVDQRSLNVAGDSAKTLSVLGNMGGVLDDCGLRFLQMCRRPLKIPPDFGGPISKKSEKGHRFFSHFRP